VEDEKLGIEYIDGNLLKRIIIAGANELDRRKREIDDLNVFPVPDGDTGTNMSLTVLTAAREVEKLSTPNISEVAKAASSGSLRGARGNSGVILSQLFRGFAKGLEGKGVANAEDIADALISAARTAYKAVMKPKEGTILTVARVMSECAGEEALYTEDLEEVITKALQKGDETLKLTTDMLPQLKQAGVVDAGGMGLLVFLKGGIASLYDKSEIKVVGEWVTGTAPSAIFDADIKFGYCTEFFINLKDKRIESEIEELENSVKKYLDTQGDSIVVVGDEDVIKVHVHTNHPGTVLEWALKQGNLNSIKIENMKLQHTSLINFTKKTNGDRMVNSKREWKEYGFAAVLSGAGFEELFRELGAAEIIKGGQTMNPSTEDILACIEKVQADNIVILPNNKNIILAAEQAAKMCKDRNVIVVPSVNIPQGITALLNFIPDKSPEVNRGLMEEAMSQVKTGQLTYAVRDTVVNGREIAEGDIIGVREDEIVHSGKDVQEGAKNLADKLMEEGGDIITLYYGKDVSEEDAAKVQAYLAEKYPQVEVELQSGGQPLYYYIISVE